MTSVVTAIRDTLVGIGEYGRPCGIKPWVVADIVRYFERRPPVEGMVFLALARGGSVGDVSGGAAVYPRLRCMASLLDTSVMVG